jgi:hypothetical protein
MPLVQLSEPNTFQIARETPECVASPCIQATYDSWPASLLGKSSLPFVSYVQQYKGDTFFPSLT